jgi:sec-independent protein translocase protein TatC
MSSEIPQLNKLVSNYSPYLTEIKRRIIFTLSFFAFSSILGFIFYDKIIKILIGFLSLKGINIVFTSPFQFINLAISCGLTTGLVVVFPFLIYQILSFLKPALRAKEYRIVVQFLPFFIILFIVGFSFGLIIMKWQIELFLNKSESLGIGNILDISHLLSTVLIVSVLMGIAFQFPIVLSLIMRLGIIKHKTLSKQRKWIYFGALLFTILLPADSILVDFLLALPIIILFELTLILHRIFEKNKS